MTKKYALNVKTGFIFRYAVMDDGTAVGYDWNYAFNNKQYIKFGFKTLEEAIKHFKEISCKKKAKKRSKGSKKS